MLREEGDVVRGGSVDGPRGLAVGLVEDQLVAPERLVSRTMPETVKCNASITCNKILILLSKYYISCNVLLQYTGGNGGGQSSYTALAHYVLTPKCSAVQEL